MPRPEMTDADWRDLIDLLVAGAQKTGAYDRAKELVCKLSSIETFGKIDAAGFAGALDILEGRKFYRVAETRRILAEVR